MGLTHNNEVLSTLCCGHIASFEGYYYSSGVCLQEYTLRLCYLSVTVEIHFWWPPNPLLSNFRFYSHIGPGDTINVIGDFDDQGQCVVDRDNNLVIVHPDILVSGTRV